MTCNCVLNL